MTELHAKRPDRAPVHPGAILLEDVLPALEMNMTEAAEALGISRNMLYKIGHGTSAITPETALRIGKLAGNGPELWLRMQNSYDLWHARKKLEKDLKRIPAPKSAAGGVRVKDK